jgi:hypothetical protein
MRLPGFTAEASLHRSPLLFSGGSTLTSGLRVGPVIAQLYQVGVGYGLHNWPTPCAPGCWRGSDGLCHCWSVLSPLGL